MQLRFPSSSSSMKKIFFLLILFHAGFCFPQADSLKKCLEISHGQDRLKILNRLIASDTSHGFIIYYNKGISLARQMHDVAGEIHILCAAGDHYIDKSWPDSAIVYYEKGLLLAKANKLRHEIILCLWKSGMAYENNAHFAMAETFYTEALSESRKSGDLKEIAGALENLGIFFLYQRNDSAALDCFNQQSKLVEQLTDSLGICICLNNIGLVYSNEGKYLNSIGYYKQSLEIEKRQNRTEAIAQSLINIGIAYKDLGAFDFALEHLLEAARYLEKKTVSIELASCYNTIGLLLMDLGKTDQALYYHYMALEIRLKLDYKRGIAGSLTNIGEAYKQKGQYSLSLDFLNRSVEIKQKLNDKALLASSLDLLGEVYYLTGNFEKSENLYQQALSSETGDLKHQATTLNKLGTLYTAWKKYDLAIQQLHKGREIADAAGTKKLLLDNYEITIKAFREKKDFENALLFSDKYIALESEMEEQKNKALTEFQVQSETAKKEQEINLMREKGRAQAAVVSQKNTLIYSLYAGTALLIIIVLVSLKAYRTGLKANKQNKVIIAQKQMLIEQKQNVMKELHHRVKNNLQVLSSLLSLQQQRLEDPSTKEAIKAVNGRLNAMLLIHQDLYGDEVDSEVDLHDYIRKLADNLLFSFGYSKENLRLNLSANDLKLDADKALNIGFVCNEMISNACKHAFSKTEHPELNIIFKKEENNIHFIFGDNGSGIPDKNSLEKTSSFGFRLIQMFIKDLKGTLSISSGEKGSSFEFIIPLNTKS